MKTRTLYAILAAALLLPLTPAAALSEVPGLRLKIDPAELHLAPGATATIVLYVHADHDTTARIASRAGDAIRLDPASAEIRLVAGEMSRIAFTLQAPAAEGKYAYALLATNDAGAEQSVTGYVIVRATPPTCSADPTTATHECKPMREPEPTKPMPREPARARPVYPEHDRRILSILERIERLLTLMEERNYGRHAPSPTRPTPEPQPLPPAVDLTLADESVDVSADGRKVALLVESRGGSGRVPLEVRFDESSGWRIGLEKDVAFVHEHDRTWIWVTLSPGHTESVEFAVYAGDAVAKGVARYDGPRIA